MNELPISAAVKSALFNYRSILLLTGSALCLTTPAFSLAAAQSDATQAAAPVEATFNSNFLVGQAQGVDLSRFRDGNPVLAGKYSLDVYVNGEWKGKKNIEFKSVPGKDSADTCFNLLSLEEFGVDTAAMGSDPAVTTSSCKPLGEWVPEASYRLNTSTLRMDVSVPQVALRRTARGYVDPKFWDRGITAGFLSYNFNAFNSHSSNSGGNSDSTNAYLTMNAGVNIAGWQLRHDSNVNWRSQESTHWQNTATYAQRAIPAVRGMLTLGDAFTSGDFFDSIGFRGAQLSTDDRMLPDSLNGYAPVVRGVAQSNALVEIRQNNQLIYQTTVAPGEFVINDLFPTGYGGDLDVTVNEADGSVRQFSVPYASVAQMLRPGIQRYALTAGQVRDDNLHTLPEMFQATYQRGFTNILTGYTGATVSDGYSAVLLGSAVATPLGAFAVDVTQANTRLKQGDMSGQSYKISYSKLMSETNTNFTIAAYRYSTSGYLSLRDAVYARDNESRGLSADAVNRQRSEYQLTLNQGLGANLGSLYITGSVRDYWNRGGTSKQYQVGYNNFIGRVTYGLSAMRTTDTYNHDETRYFLNFSIPFNIGSQNISLNSALAYNDQGYDSSRIGINGSTGEDNNISYSATLANDQSGGTNTSVNGEYRSRFATMNGSYSYGRDFRQSSIGASGSIVAHSGGVTMTPQRGQTMVLVEAPDAAGAIVTNSPGVRIDDNGYAVVPYVAPYRMTNVTLDPNGMSRDVELESSSQQIAPYAGAIAKLEFKTIKGQALIIHALGPNNTALPFGAEVLDTRNQVVGIVGQGSRIYLRTEALQGLLLVKWGTQPTQQCAVNYQAKAQNSTDYEIIEASCK
ncbi:fimbria/pilus outer membrane usher protein [Serratia fonticola]|uniref:Fimbrial biogenesis outer membrane usher protein n=1 Tax=Serratia fonticola TaxID=47917 RepID=A0AAW3WQJ9_SERFO|nr:fimbria/pilus outer membrane usher protein [Serratia fonticola]MBC3213106.1 fimbrial biogenesis outer membrane usher protein [Serratia fonticola]NYA13329.1 fimbrial biogenesis outer membrane usher protein [Serratia fonticola]NYA33656.1 fimbrial biogenesis outer membrane usher protein [Serratia fonticola]